MRFRFRTAGESHGRGLFGLVEGVPAGLPLSAERDIDVELRRRQAGYGRGGRMRIEQDRAEILSGVRHGETIGSPIGLLIWNRDWENWRVAMAVEPAEAGADLRPVHLPRPGHADLVGALKYERDDARDILERASARETAARVACGAVARRLLAELGIRVASHVTGLGSVQARVQQPLPDDLNAAADRSPLRTLDPDAEARMIEEIDAARTRGDTLGGTFEVIATGLPAGLGSHVAWDERLDGRLAQALLSVQAVKGVEIGRAFDVASRPGSAAHDEIAYDPAARRGGGFRRPSNHAGGLEGGMTTGEPLVVRGAMKPLSTLMTPLASVDLRTRQAASATRERSDVVALPAAAVVAESMVAIVLADAALQKFGGDSLSELRRNFDSYLDALSRRHMDPPG